jgi:hypothetical protein
MSRRHSLLTLAVIPGTAFQITTSAWKNPRQSDTLDTPIFGTHDEEVTRARGELRTPKALAAFYAGALAHYVGMRIERTSASWRRANRAEEREP